MIDRTRFAALVAAWMVAMMAAPATGAGIADPLERPALITPRAKSAVLLGISAAGERLTAVGERGIALLSDDAGGQWRQVPTPVSTTLTAVRFVDPRRGWAVGHAGVVLHTADGGQTWSRQLNGIAAAQLVVKAAANDGPAAQRVAERLSADGPDKPFLDLHFSDAQRGMIVGAYGLIFGTKDGGATWSPWLDRVDNPKALHLNAVAVRGKSILIAGEQGLLLHSVDGGLHFSRLESPYAGSWFAVLALPTEGRWLVGGLRGRAYLFDEASGVFTASESAVPVTLSSFTLLGDGRVVALNQAGQALLSRDAGKSFQPLPVPPGAPMTGLQALNNGELVASSLRGVRSLRVLP